MQRNLFFIVAFLSIIFHPKSVFSQSPQWVVPPLVLDFTPTSIGDPIATSNLPTLFADAGNGVFDDNGNLLFYLVGDQIFDAAGTSLAFIFTNNTASQEPNIVPVPGVSDRWFVIYAEPTTSLQANLFFTEVEHNPTNGQVSIVPGRLNVPFGLGSFGFPNFAVSRLNASNERFLYLVGPSRVQKHIISSTGISNGTVIFSVFTSPNTIFQNNEAELSGDGTKLAWGVSDDFFGEINILTLDANGDFVSNQLLNLPGGTLGVWGLEFSPCGDKLFFSSGTAASPSANDGLNGYDLSTAIPTFFHIPNSGSYTNTHLELAVDGYIYATSNADLAAINPVNNALRTGLLNLSGLAFPLGSRVLPDQIDAERFYEVGDLWIPDGGGDTGHEPDIESVHLWLGRVWNCTDNPSCGSNQPPEYKMFGNNYMRVRVRNRGCVDTEPAQLRLYWTRARIDEDWDEDWLDPALRPQNQINGCAAGGEVTVAAGSVNSQPINVPPIPPGGAVVFTHAWRPPNVTCFPPGSPGQFNNNGDPLVCYLARVESPNDPINNEQFGPIKHNIFMSNNVATRNSYLVDLNPVNIIGPGAHIAVGILSAPHFNLRFAQLDPGVGNFGEHGDIYLQLSEDLWEDWVDGGMSGEGIEVTGEYEVRVTNASFANLVNITYRDGRYYVIRPEFRLAEGTEFGEDQSFSYILDHTDTNHPDGGSAGVYEVRISEECQVDVPSEYMVAEPGACTQIGAPISCDNCEITWVPEYGLSDPHAAVTEACVEETTVYKLTVVNNETGCETSEKVTVYVDEGRRRTEEVTPTDLMVNEVMVSPNPLQDQTTIHYKLAQATTVSIRLFDNMGRVVAQPLNPAQREAGLHAQSIDASTLSAGIYLCEVQLGDSKKIVRLVVQ